MLGVCAIAVTITSNAPGDGARLRRRGCLIPKNRMVYARTVEWHPNGRSTGERPLRGDNLRPGQIVPGSAIL